MYIRLKVKTLFLLIVGFLVVCLAAYITMPLYLLHAKAYGAVAAYFPFNPKAPEALIKEAEAFDGMPGPTPIYIFPGNELSGSPGVTSLANISLAQNALQRLVARYPHSNYAPEAKWQLALMDEQTGNWAGAIQKLKGIASAPGPHHVDATNELAKIEHQDAHSNGPTDVTGRVTKGGQPIAHAYVFLRAYSERNMFSTDVKQSYVGAYTDDNGVFRISGVRSDGAYQVCIGISPAQVSGYYLPVPLDAVVHVKRGTVAHYNIQFVRQVSVIAPTGGTTIHGDTIQFSWHAYPGAVSYVLHITDFVGSPPGYGSVTIQLPGTFPGTTATYSLTSLRHILAGPSWNDNGLIGASALGAVYPGGKFSWSVDALDANGQIVSSSSGYYLGPMGQNPPIPIFYTDAAGQLAGDKYMLQGQIDKAKAAYQQEIPNPFALRALALLALYGHVDKQGGISGNPQLALKYLRQIKNPTEDIQSLLSEAQKQLDQNSQPK